MNINWIGTATLYKRETWRFLKVWNQTLIAPMIELANISGPATLLAA